MRRSPTAETKALASELLGLYSVLSDMFFFPPNLFPCSQVPGMQEILLIGFYQPDEALTRFLEAAQQEFNLPIRCLCSMGAMGCVGRGSSAQGLRVLVSGLSQHSADFALIY